jgi:hypothetical protein
MPKTKNSKDEEVWFTVMDIEVFKGVKICC